MPKFSQAAQKGPQITTKNTKMLKNVGLHEHVPNSNGGSISCTRQDTVHFNSFLISSESAHSKYVLPFGAFSDLEAPFTHTHAYTRTHIHTYKQPSHSLITQ